jgi:Mg/Co/Ni transporter MgtE
MRSACLRVEEAVEMTDENRIARLAAEIEDLPFEEREAVIASLSDDDRAAVRDAQLEHREAAEDDDELGGEA